MLNPETNTQCDTNKTDSSECSEKPPTCVLSDTELLNLFKEWNAKINPDEQIFYKDYMFKDPLIPKLKPTEAFCYTLGNS